MRHAKHVLTMSTAILLGVGALAATASAPSPANETTNYTYDALGRLVKVEQEGGVNNGIVSNYSYDKAGNRANVNVTGAH
ncbi:hypothetical protein FHR20_001564 [Sphingomonas leidyi]|uniref:RHS repeat protein n=1 Tax=Sphingomonas leidyi TaxID=68569 RepID=A0A7X5ZVP8_9SPHN|nr:hypothetical protein [Sphingomonas leidyi]NIJ64633.1 hypothetical protein [Sphingomonas leidyi]